MKKLVLCMTAALALSAVPAHAGDTRSEEAKPADGKAAKKEKEKEKDKKPPGGDKRPDAPIPPPPT